MTPTLTLLTALLAASHSVARADDALVVWRSKSASPGPASFHNNFACGVNDEMTVDGWKTSKKN